MSEICSLPKQNSIYSNGYYGVYDMTILFNDTNMAYSYSCL